MVYNSSLIIEKTEVSNGIVELMKTNITNDKLTHYMLKDIINHCEALIKSDF